jgi:hypothetical protein
MSEDKSGFSMGKLVDMLFPVLLAAVGWLLSEIASFNNRLIAMEGKMPALITAEGVPTDSPISAERRQRQKEELLEKIYDLQLRVKLLEQGKVK